MNIADLGFRNHLLTFTPLRQQRGGYTNKTTPRQDAGKEWTTARCHRLLRALTSRVAILTKDLTRFSAANQPENSSARSIEEAKSPDGDWNYTKKKIRQTYSVKGRKGNHAQNGEKSRILLQSRTRRSLIPGEVSVPTPILARARGECGEEEAPRNVQPEPEERDLGKGKRQRTKYGLENTNTNFQLSEPLRELRHKMSAARFTTYEGIYNGLEALLVATAPAKPEVKRKGARSLFAMALRAVPGYISQQEGLVDAHMEETGSKSAITGRDMTTEIYDELEDFGLTGHGWKHLKTVVRSHGIQVLKEAIRAGVLEVNFIGCLITLCVQVSALDEGQVLFASTLSSTHFSPPRSIYEKPNRLLSMLWKFTEHTGASSFQYRELLNLFNLGLLPVDWIATKTFGHVWTGIFQTLSSDSGDIEALIFLDALLPKLFSASSDELIVGYAAISEAINNTFSSVLTTLSSIVILSDERQTPHGGTASGSSKDIITLLHGCCTLVLNEIEMVGVLPILSVLFTPGQGSSQDDSILVDLLIEQLQQDQGTDPKPYARAVSFTCSIARCCGRGALTSGFGHLQHMHHVLEACCKGGRANVLKSLIVDSAFAFAEQIPNREHLQYAAEMDAKFCVRRFEPDSSSHSLPDEGEHRSGFRWEEGIGEWVTASPIAAKKSATIIANKANVECDTLYQPPAERRRRVEDASFLSPRAASEPKETTIVESSDLSLDLGEDLSFAAYEMCLEEQDQLSHSESDDELGPDSSQLNGSFVSDVSFERAEVSFAEQSFASTKSSVSSRSTKSAVSRRSIERAPRLNKRVLFSNQDWTMFEDSSISIASSVGSNGGSAGNRQLIDRAPRLGRKALRSSQTWQVFDESDDELSFISVSSQEEKPLQEVTNTNTHRLKRWAEKVPSVQSKPTKRRTVIDSDSEDELCM